MKRKLLFLITLVVSLCATSCIEYDAEPEGSISYIADEITWEGGYVGLTISSNCNWLIYQADEELSFSKTSGNGSEIIYATVPKNEKEEEAVYSFLFRLETETMYTECTVTIVVPAKPKLEESTQEQ